MIDKRYPQIIGSATEQPHTPQEVDDTLRSGSTARIIELLCEGPIEGFAGEPKECIFLENTPVRSPGLSTSDWSSSALVDFTTSSNTRFYVTNIVDVVAHVAVSDTIEFPNGRSNVTAVVETTARSGYNGYIEAWPRVFNTSVEVTTTYTVKRAAFDNFKDFSYRISYGTPDTTNQQPLIAFDSTDNYVSVGAPLQMRYPDYNHRPPAGTPISSVELLKPVVRQIDNVEVGRVNIIIQIDELWVKKTNGDVEQALAAFEIETRTDTTNWKHAAELQVLGKCRSPVQKSVLVTLPDVPTSGLTYRQIRITKTAGYDSGRVDHLFTHDVYTTAGGNTSLAGYTEIIDVQQTYPNTAVIGFTVDAEQFSSIPSRKYLMNLLKVKLPTGYTPRTPKGYIGTPVTQATYPTVWDGTFNGFAWSDNPVWCLRDLLLSKRYGLGRYIDATQLDDYAMYQAAKHCDELVPDGRGGTEPRFTLNCILTSKDQALAVVRNIMFVLRGMGLWNGSRFTVVQDRPSLGITMQYTPANVEDGMFHYTGSSISQRHTAAVVAWVDPAQQYKTDYEYVEDLDGIARYGVKKLEITAFGCTSRGQARRVGKWALLSELYEREQVSFTVGLDSMLVMPGDVIQITDPNRLASPTNAGDESDRLGGRLLSATTNLLKLDSSVTLLAGETYKLSVLLPDGTVEDQQCYVKNTTPTAGGTGDELQVLAPFSQTPASGAIWLLYRETLKPFMARVLSVGIAEGGKYNITAQQYFPDKYAAVDADAQFDPAPTTNLPDPGFCPPPTNLQATEIVYTTNTGLTFADIEVTWDVPATGVIAGYEVSYRGGKIGSWTKLPRVSWPLLDIKQVEPADYDIQVVAYNFAGKASAPVMVTVSATGKTTPPADPMTFIATGQVMQIELRWTYANEPDIKLVELWAATVNDRSQAIKLTELAYPQNTYMHLGLGLNVHMYYWLRAKDTSGNFSDWVTANAVTSHDPSEFQKLLQDSVNRSMLIKDLLTDVDNPALALLDLSHRVSWMSDMLRDLKTKSDAVIEVDPEHGTIRLKTMAKVDQLAAAVRMEISSRVEGDTAISQMITDIGSTSDDLAAAIHEEAITRANAVSALADKIDTVSATSGNLSATVQQLMHTEVNKVDNSVKAVYELKVQTLVNNRKVVAGFGLVSDGVASEFAVMANKFFVVDPSSESVTPMFVVDNSSGAPKMVMNGNLITVGTISASGITAGTLSADIEISTGSIKSNNYVAGSAGWKIDATGAEFSNALFRGSIEASNLKIGAGGISLKANGVDINATAFGQVVCQDVSGSNVIADAHHALSAPSGPLTGAKVTFYGPGHGSAPPVANRVRAGNVLFSAHATAVMDHHVALIYRVDGGAWTLLHYTQEPNNGYGAVGIQYSITLPIFSMTTVQFALCPADPALNVPDERGIIDGSLTVTAFNL